MVEKELDKSWTCWSFSLYQLDFELKCRLLLVRLWRYFARSAFQEPIGWEPHLPLLVVRPASVTSPLISTIWGFRSYKSNIFCKDMILATCHHHHIFIWWSSYYHMMIIISSYSTKHPTCGAVFLKSRGIKVIKYDTQASLVHHLYIIRASSLHHKYIIYAPAVHHQCTIWALSVHTQRIISA